VRCATLTDSELPFKQLSLGALSKRRFFQDPPVYTMKSLDGAVLNLDALLGKVTMIHFWSTWCGGCVDELPSLVEFAQSKRDVMNFVPISHDRSLEALQEFLGANSWTQRLRWYLNLEGEFYWQRLGGVFIPASCFLNKDGKLAVFWQDGVITPLLIGEQPWHEDFYSRLVDDIYSK